MCDDEGGMREKEEVPKEDSERGTRVWEGQGRMVTSKASRECSVRTDFCKGTQAGGSSEGGAERQEARRLKTTSSFVFLFCQSRLVSPLLGGPRANTRSRRWSSEGNACVRWGSRRLPADAPLGLGRPCVSWGGDLTSLSLIPSSTRQV